MCEDDSIDTLMVTEVVADTGVRLHTVRAGNGTPAFLLGAGDHGDALRPGLVRGLPPK